MNRTTLIAGLITLVFLASCGSKSNKNKKERTDTYSSGVVAITSDESFSPIIQQEIEIFENTYPQAHIIPIYTSEVDALNLLFKDSVKVCIVARNATPKELAYFTSKQQQPKITHIATDGIALVVNRANKDTLISVDQFRKILTGGITKWNQLGAKSVKGEITLVFDNPNSSTVRFAIDSVAKGKPLNEKIVRAKKTSKQVIEYVKNNKNAIGVVGVNWVEDGKDSTNTTYIDDVTIMSVSAEKLPSSVTCYKPYQYYLWSGEYPLTRNIYVWNNDPRQGLWWGFAQFLQGDKGQRIFLKAGLLPETQPVRLVDVNDN
jgi:phosphate transport system substrate-binding protein